MTFSCSIQGPLLAAVQSLQFLPQKLLRLRTSRSLAEIQRPEVRPSSKPLTPTSAPSSRGHDFSSACHGHSKTAQEHCHSYWVVAVNPRALWLPCCDPRSVCTFRGSRTKGHRLIQLPRGNPIPRRSRAKPPSSETPRARIRFASHKPTSKRNVFGNEQL